MANRRMFSLSIVNTDNFLDMPATTQSLYFHLGMRADDEGFVSSPKKIATLANCSNDDLKLLVSKGYIIPFESGVIVITHWKQNNYIQLDRYQKTIYEKEREQLVLERNVYKLDTENIQEVSNLYPQVRLGKDRDRDKKEREYINYQQIADMYNDICISFPRLTKLSDKRKQAIRARMKTYSVEDFRKLFEMAEESSFLKGQNKRNWSATFDWLVADGNMAKVLDGNYTDNGTRQQSSQSTGNDDYAVYQEMYRNLPSSPDDPFQ